MALCISVFPYSLFAVTHTEHPTMHMSYVYGWVGVPQCIYMPSQLSHCLPPSQWRDGLERMTNPSLCVCTRSSKTQRERSTRQISPSWPRLPPRTAQRSTSCPSLRSPCPSPSSLADPVRRCTTLTTHITPQIKKIIQMTCVAPQHCF